MSGSPMQRLWHLLGSSMVARIGMAAVNFGLFWLLSHHLGATALGGFSLLMNLFLMLQLLPLLGLSLPLSRRIATEEGDREVEVSNAFAFALPVGLAIALVLGLVGQFGYPDWLHGPFWLVAAAIVPTTWVIVAESALLGLERAADIARVQFGEAALRTALAVVAVWREWDLVGVFAIFLLLRCLSAWRYAVHPAVPRPRRAQVSAALQRRNWQEVPIYLGIALLAALTSRLDLVVLSRLDDLHAVGQYAAASRLYDAALMLPTLAALILMPTLARLYATEPEAFAPMLRKALRASLAAGMAIALAVAALADPVIELLYLPEFHDAAPVLRWLIFAAVWVTVDQTLSSTMIAAQAQHHDLRTMALALVLLVTGLAVLVPLQGPVGAAEAVTLALIGRVLWRLRWAAHRLALPQVWPDLARVCVATAAGLAGLLAGLHWHGAWVALVAAWAAYALAARLLGLIGAHPVRTLVNELARLRGRAA